MQYKPLVDSVNSPTYIRDSRVVDVRDVSEGNALLGVIEQNRVLGGHSKNHTIRQTVEK